MSSSSSMVVMAMDGARTQWGWPRGLGKMKLGFRDVLTMLRRVSNYSSSRRESLRLEISLGHPP